MGTVTKLRLTPPSERPHGEASLPGWLSTCRSALIALVALGTACTVHQDKAPSVTGPSEFGQSVNITATPDSISQDGASQSSILVVVRGPNGEGLSGVPMRLDIAVNGVVQDFGRLSSKSIVTDSNGRATAIYVAPPAPPRSSVGPNNIVTIRVTPTGSNFQTSISQSVDIRLVRTGVILPPGATPTAVFTFRPDPASVNVQTTFDASASCATSDDPCTSTAGITSFQWNFGDGTTGAGQTTNKTFRTAGTYTVTLTVTNALGLAASTPQQVTVGISEAPTADFVFSPSSPAVGQEVQFNASTSQAVAGRTITRYSWNWGDGETATGRLQDHDFQTAGAFTVTLSVTDDAGQSGTTSQSVNVGIGAPAVVITTSPGAPNPGTVVQFNSDGTTYFPGSGPASFAWTFGDGVSCSTAAPAGCGLGTPANPSHAYATIGEYSVGLSVTDTEGRTGTGTATVTVALVPPPTPPAPPVAAFTPTATSLPTGGGVVNFDSASSTSPSGAPITNYRWNFGDGTGIVNTTSQTVSHPYTVVGTHTVTLIVTTGSNGLTGTTTGTVTVAP